MVIKIRQGQDQIHVLREFNKVFLKQLLLKVYKSYIQSKSDYWLPIWWCTSEGNHDRVQIIKNSCAGITGIYKNMMYIKTRGIDLVQSLQVHTIRQRSCPVAPLLTWINFNPIMDK